MPGVAHMGVIPPASIWGWGLIAEVPATIDAIDARWVSLVVGSADVSEITTNRIGEGFGLAAETHRVDFVDADMLPLAVKLCDAATADAEVHVYRHVLSRTNTSRPVLVEAATDGERGVVVYQYIAGATQGDILAGCSDATLERIVDELAELHAAWWCRAGDAGVPAAGERMRRELTDAHIDACLERLGGALETDAVALIRSMPGRVDDVIDELVSHPLTVVHADAHLDNMLIRGDGSPVILDWSTARVAPAALDLARIQIECMMPEQRRRLRPRMAQRHHRALTDRGIGDYSIDELERAVDLAHLAFIPGLVRWGARERRKDHPARADLLLRAGLIATTDAVLGR